jgi:hypothetical protein
MKPLVMAVSMLFVLGVVLASDTATDFSQRYGPPIRESYEVRPGIVASVSYGASGHACEILIEPNQSGGMIKSRGVTIDSKQLTDVLDEIVPAKERGAIRMGGFVNAICLPSNDCNGTESSWDAVSIYRNGGTNDEHYATIEWRRAECQRETANPPVSNP